MNLFARRSGFSSAANGAFFFGSQRLRILQIELELLFDLKITGRPCSFLVKGLKFQNKLWCWVIGEYCKIIWFYELG